MMKNIVLLLFSALLLTSCITSSIDGENAREFSVEAAKVDEIFLSDTRGNKIHLVKNEDRWDLNDNYVARPDAVKKLLETIEYVRFRNPVPENGQEQAIKNLIADHRKIEIYSQGKPIMSYFVGGQSKDGNGTYMLKQDVESGENAEQVFITEIPGFNGYLTPRYITTETAWRETTVFRYNQGELASLKLEYPTRPDEAFEFKINEGHVSMFDAQGNEVQAFDKAMAKGYLLNYKQINFEAIATIELQQLTDSLHASTPYYIITATNNKGVENKLVAHRRKAQEGEQDPEGNQLEFDTDRLFAFINNQEELFIIQYYVFDKLTVGKSMFLNNPS